MSSERTAHIRTIRVVNMPYYSGDFKTKRKLPAHRFINILAIGGV